MWILSFPTNPLVAWESPNLQLDVDTIPFAVICPRDETPEEVYLVGVGHLRGKQGCETRKRRDRKAAVKEAYSSIPPGDCEAHTLVIPEGQGNWTASSYTNLSVKVEAQPGLFIPQHSDHGDMDKGPLETKKPALEQRRDADGIGVEPIGQAVVFVTRQQIQQYLHSQKRFWNPT